MMPRLMSVAMTEQAVVERTKTVTRRLGWNHAEVGMPLTLCRKVQGRSRRLPDGTRHVEPLVRLAEVEVVSIDFTQLCELVEDPAYGAAEVAAEGFPGMDPAVFLDRYFVQAQGCRLTDWVNRIEWRYLDAELLPL